jgi:hypothetical protein
VAVVASQIAWILFLIGVVLLIVHRILGAASDRLCDDGSSDAMKAALFGATPGI